jgi:hypothetical protein
LRFVYFLFIFFAAPRRGYPFTVAFWLSPSALASAHCASIFLKDVCVLLKVGVLGAGQINEL